MRPGPAFRSVAGLTTTVVVCGCFLRRDNSGAEPAQRRDASNPVASLTVHPDSVRAIGVDSMVEPRVDLEMVNAPVKLVLQKLADLGGLELIIPPNLNRTVSVQYVHVPVSVALADVLARSGLRLGPAAMPNLPFDMATVFYRLPANVDSLSADAIVRRFGVSKGLAALIVKSRRP